ncbi:MAG: hypothetical protein ILA52_00040 [Alphaproteobacteria bacterium]|nr:hypothetical protein [Alphaproteobacteria bacterium]
MYIQKVIDHVENKDHMWRDIFCCFYLQQKNLFKDLYLQLTKNGKHFDMDPRKLIAFSHSIDELEQVWELVEFVDSNEQKIAEELGKIMQLRPMPWVADFVDAITKVLGYQVVKRFQIDEICFIYCLALQEKSLDVEELQKNLDDKYRIIYASASQKQRLLKRNFLLLLEDYYGSVNWLDQNSTFREIVNAFLPRCGYDNIVKILHRAKTPENRLTPAENACFGYFYYTPFVEQKKEYEDGKMLAGCLFSCVEEYIKNGRDVYGKILQQVDDEDEIDELPKYDLSYMDPMECCMMEMKYTDNCFTNVYVEKIPGAFLINSLADCICCRNGCLYTVEVVDNLHNLPVYQEIRQKVNGIKKQLLELEQKGKKDPEFASSGEFALKKHRLQASLTCFYYAM